MKQDSTGLFTNFNSFIPVTYKKGLLLSLISRYSLIFVPLIILFTLNFRTLNKYSLVMVIQPLLLITALGLFSTKYSHLNYLFTHAQKRLFTFAYRTQANTFYNYVRNFVN